VEEEIRLLVVKRDGLLDKETSLCKEIELLQKELKLMKEKPQEFIGKLPKSKEELRVERELKNVSKILEELKEKYTAEHPQIESLRIKIKRLQGELKDARMLSYREALSLVEAKICSCRERLARLREDLMELDRKRARLTEKREAYLAKKGEIQELEKKISALTRTIGELRLEASLIPEYIDVEKYAREAELQRRWKVNLPLCILISLMVGVSAGYIADYLDTRLRTNYDVRRYLNLDVLGNIPYIKEPEKILLDVPLSSPLCEVFNCLGTVICAFLERFPVSLAIVSPSIGDGKTLIAVNLSIALARSGKRVILIDGDLRIPRLNEIFELPNKEGLSTFLEGRFEAQKILDLLEEKEPSLGLERILFQTRVENLFVMPSGPLPINTIKLFSSDMLGVLIKYLKERMDLVIFDSPPIERVADSVVLSQKVDKTILIISARDTTREQGIISKKLLIDAGARMLGVVLNYSTFEIPRYYYYYKRRA
jgi:capsular exopolysaccharide synthesis family protein